MAFISWSIGITLVVTNVWIVYISILLQIDSWSACPVKDFVYHRKSQISLKDCAKECSKRQSCTGLGYRRRYLLCELYFESVLQTESPSLKDPCVFIRRDQIKTEQVIFYSYSCLRNAKPIYKEMRKSNCQPRKSKSEDLIDTKNILVYLSGQKDNKNYLLPLA